MRVCLLGRNAGGFAVPLHQRPDAVARDGLVIARGKQRARRRAALAQPSLHGGAFDLQQMVFTGPRSLQPANEESPSRRLVIAEVELAQLASAQPAVIRQRKHRFIPDVGDDFEEPVNLFDS